MRLRVMGVCLLGLMLGGAVYADSVVIEEAPKKEAAPKKKKQIPPATVEKKEVYIKKDITHNQNIRIQHEVVSGEKLHEEKKYFCSSTSKAEAEKNCDQWLAAQKKSAGSRVVFASCSQATDLYGEKDERGCMAYTCTGEIKFLLNQRK